MMDRFEYFIIDSAMKNGNENNFAWQKKDHPFARMVLLCWVFSVN